jgi:CHASE1-domain containing sensor protein
MGSFYYLNKIKIDSNELLIKEAVLETNNKITKELKKITLAISSLQMLFETSSQISREEFTRFALPFLEGLPGIKALEWAPLIADSTRGDFEEAVRKEGLTTFSIVQTDSAKKKFVSALPKATYFPCILYCSNFFE